jgi:hypothetical protein
MTKIEVQCIEKSKRGIFTFAAVNNPAMTFKSAGNGFLIGKKYILSILPGGSIEIVLKGE